MHGLFHLKVAVYHYYMYGLFRMEKERENKNGKRKTRNR